MTDLKEITPEDWNTIRIALEVADDKPESWAREVEALYEKLQRLRLL